MAVILCGREHPRTDQGGDLLARAAQHDTVIHLNRQNPVIKSRCTLI